MNYGTPELLDRLAAGHVLGTLQGRARQRFEGILAGDLQARLAVARWEMKLAPLSMELAPIEPPRRVWRRIEERLRIRRASRVGGGVWQALAAVLAVAAIGLGAYVLTREPKVEVQVALNKPDHVAVFTTPDAKPLWLLSAYSAAGELRAVAVNVPALAHDKDYELWMVPKSGAAAVSLGLLPASGEVTLPLDAKASAILAASGILAVSLEPAGGSPTGVATGPVIYTAPLVHAG